MKSSEIQKALNAVTLNVSIISGDVENHSDWESGRWIDVDLLRSSAVLLNNLCDQLEAERSE